MKLSKRLQAVADMCIKGNVIADIGTDHGYLPIYLALNGVSSKIIAMDVRTGPLEHAKKHVNQFNVSDIVEMRLSDGLDKLSEAEASTITICGMGGKLMETIITKGMNKLTKDTQLILSPQSEIGDFRRFLNENGFSIIKETMIKEDDKYYTIMDCRYDEEPKRDYSEIHFLYGKYLLENKNEILKEFLQKESKSLNTIINELNKVDSKDSVKKRLYDLESLHNHIVEALNYFK